MLLVKNHTGPLYSQSVLSPGIGGLLHGTTQLWGRSFLSWSWDGGVSLWWTLNVTVPNFSMLVFLSRYTQKRFLQAEVLQSCPCPTCHFLTIRGNLCSFYSPASSRADTKPAVLVESLPWLWILRSGSAQLEVEEFTAMIFITIVVMKHRLFGLFFWQSSAEVANVCHSVLISVVNRCPCCIT